MRGVWAAKAVVQKSISVLPRAQRVNRRFQQVTGRLGLTPDVVLQRLEWAGRDMPACAADLVAHCQDCPGDATDG